MGLGYATAHAGGAGVQGAVSPVPREHFPTVDRTHARASEADFAKLRAIAEDEGSVRVIVGLRVAFTPEGVLSGRGRDAQHSAIDDATAAVRARRPRQPPPRRPHLRDRPLHRARALGRGARPPRGLRGGGDAPARHARPRDPGAEHADRRGHRGRGRRSRRQRTGGRGPRHRRRQVAPLPAAVARRAEGALRGLLLRRCRLSRRRHPEHCQRVGRSLHLRAVRMQARHPRRRDRGRQGRLVLGRRSAGAADLDPGVLAL